MIRLRSILRLMIQWDRRAGDSLRVPDCCRAGESPATQALCEVIFVGSFVPNNLLVVLMRQRRHVTGDSRLLSYWRRGDRLFLALNRIDEILEMVDRAVALVEVGLAVEVYRLAGRH